jgi:hypothetical protein
MATYSNIGIKLITTGDESGTWGDTTNTNFSGVLDEAIAGVVTYNISSDADVTLTVSDGSSSDARHAVINFTSTTLSATRTVTFAPDTLQKTWLVINSTTGGQSLTFKQGSAGATITVPMAKARGSIPMAQAPRMALSRKHLIASRTPRLQPAR